MTTDADRDHVSLIADAIAIKAEIALSFGGLKIAIDPYVIYTGADGTITVAGMHGTIPVHIPVPQIKDLSRTLNRFQRDPTFNLADGRYRNALAIIEGA